jgi:hypothetical protein
VARFIRSNRAVYKGASMYKIEINISVWGDDEVVTIETSDFDKIQTIREFIEFQQENGWAADYDHVVELDEMEEDEDEPTTVSTYVITVEE